MYEGTCIDCLDEVDAKNKLECDVGKYIGESSRTLAERSSEHMRGAKSFDSENFIIKHWVLHHPELERRPRIRFKVIKTFRDPLSRLVAESVLIDKLSNLNSKSEWRNNRVSRLVVETHERKKDLLNKRLQEEKDASLLASKIEDLEKRMKKKSDVKDIGRNEEEDKVADDEVVTVCKATKIRLIQCHKRKEDSVDPEAKTFSLKEERHLWLVLREE